jgi:hypothetical protein
LSPASRGGDAVLRPQPGVAGGAAPLRGAEPLSRVDGEERHPPAGAEEPGARSQHRELGAQSSQHIGVRDRIERLGSQQKPGPDAALATTSPAASAVPDAPTRPTCGSGTP